jgi:LysR family transcriptional regulator, mexEF-oprN operon transcriptional activator
MVKLNVMNDLFNENDFRRLDLNALLTFTALMRERSVTRAAARMFLGPSAVSMTLKRLREVLADPLLVRTRTGMEPTPRALAVYERVERALAEVHGAIFEPGVFDPAKLKRTFRFAAPDDLELALVPALLEALRSAAPGVRLVIQPSDFRHALASLDSSDADLALTAMPDRLESWHRHEILHRETFVCLFDPKQLPVRGKLSLNRYLTTPHLLLSPRGEMHGPIDEHLGKQGLQRTVLMSVAHFPLMPFVLRRTPCLVNMPAIAARFYAKEFGMRLSPLPIESSSFEVGLLWHARNDGDAALTWFRGMVARLVAQLRAKVLAGQKSA